MSHQPDLLTERLLLRPLVPEDEADLFLLRSDEEVNRYLDRPIPQDVGDARQFMQTINEGIAEHKWVYWAITQGEGWPGGGGGCRGKLIGTIGLFNFSEDRLTAELGYELYPAFQGRGIMQEALVKVLWFGFRILGLEQVEAFTHRDNRRSARLLEKNGFIPAPAAITPTPAQAPATAPPPAQAEALERFVRGRDVEKST